MKSKGPKIDSCGTPEVIGRSFEFLPSIEKNCFQLDEYQPVIRNVAYTIVFKFFQENYMIDCVKSLLEINEYPTREVTLIIEMGEYGTFRAILFLQFMLK